jgi:hypothetical protein
MIRLDEEAFFRHYKWIYNDKQDRMIPLDNIHFSEDAIKGFEEREKEGLLVWVKMPILTGPKEENAGVVKKEKQEEENSPHMLVLLSEGGLRSTYHINREEIVQQDFANILKETAKKMGWKI